MEEPWSLRRHSLARVAKKVTPGNSALAGTRVKWQLRADHVRTEGKSRQPAAEDDMDALYSLSSQEQGSQTRIQLGCPVLACAAAMGRLRELRKICSSKSCVAAGVSQADPRPRQAAAADTLMDKKRDLYGAFDHHLVGLVCLSQLYAIHYELSASG